MSTGKKIGGVLVCLAVIGGTVGGIVYYVTSGVAEEATAFFQAVAKDGPEAAYRRASPALQRSTSEAQFDAYVERFGLKKFKSASWPNRQITPGQGVVRGTLTFEDAGTLPAAVILTKDEAGAWKVVSVDIAPAGVASAPGAKIDDQSKERAGSSFRPESRTANECLEVQTGSLLDPGPAAGVTAMLRPPS